MDIGLLIAMFLVGLFFSRQRDGFFLGGGGGGESIAFVTIFGCPSRAENIRIELGQKIGGAYDLCLCVYLCSLVSMVCMIGALDGGPHV